MGNFVHIELNTTDAKKAKGFYKKVFGWKMADMKMPQGVYSMAEGMMNPGIGLQGNADPGMPSAWVAYIEVDDVKKTVAKAIKAGAQAPMPYFEAGEHGSGAWLVDPTGAIVAIWRSNPAAAPAASAATTTKKKATKKKATKKKATKKKATKKKATAKKRAAKKAPAKKAAAKKRAAKNDPAKKATAKKRAAKKR